MSEEGFIKYYEETRRALSEKVLIDHNEILKIVVRDLIKKRNYAPLTSYGALKGLLFAIQQLEKVGKSYVIALRPSTSSQYLQIWTRWE